MTDKKNKTCFVSVDGPYPKKIEAARVLLIGNRLILEDEGGSTVGEFKTWDYYYFKNIFVESPKKKKKEDDTIGSAFSFLEGFFKTIEDFDKKKSKS